MTASELRRRVPQFVVDRHGKTGIQAAWESAMFSADLASVHNLAREIKSSL